MKKRHVTLISLLLLVILSMTACSGSMNALPMQIMGDSAAATDADLSYICKDGSVVYTYYNAPIEDYTLLCSRYERRGYELYSTAVMGDTLSSTYVQDGAMAHVYWHFESKELNLVLSDDAGATLPHVTPPESEGEAVPCTVTQMMDDQNGIGMGYVVQLTDGSYILYDGSFASQAERIEQFLLENYRGEGKPIVRAWVLTHSHLDHFEAFKTFAQRAKEGEVPFTVEYIIAAPMNDDAYPLSAEDGTAYLSTDFFTDAAAFTGAQVVFAHTGMNFNFGNLRMEVLYSPESLYKYSGEMGYFNNTRLVTRLYDENYSALFLADIGHTGTNYLIRHYSDYLQSDMCQVSHHGMEDVPLSFYEVVQAPLLFYPCDQSVYDQYGENGHVRRGLQGKFYTKEILIAGLGQYTRPWGTTFAYDAPLSMPDYVPPQVVGDKLPVTIKRPHLPFEKAA